MFNFVYSIITITTADKMLFLDLTCPQCLAACELADLYHITVIYAKNWHIALQL